MLFRCRRCLYPNTKPDLWFDENGVCSACLAFDRRAAIDWEVRRNEFMAMVEGNRGKTHDVIVACSGGKDSTAQVVKCLELGLRPLAVTATTDHLTPLGRKNLDNISTLCDHVEITPHKPTRNKIAKFALEQVGDISWCEHHLIWSIPAREAVAREIPIVLYGECPQNEYGAGPSGSEKQERLTPAWVHEFGGLLGLRLSDMTELINIEPRHLDLYRWPEGNAQAVFMGAYFPWDGYENFLIAQRNGFTPYAGEHIGGSLYNYENLDNYQTGVHDHMRWVKFGYGRAHDIASNHIRRGRLSREDAIKLLREPTSEMPFFYLGKSFDQILGEIGVTVSEFESICDRFTNHEVVAWASSLASYQSYCGMPAAPSKASASVQAAA